LELVLFTNKKYLNSSEILSNELEKKIILKNDIFYENESAMMNFKLLTIK